MDGFRTNLANHGMSLTWTEVSEYLRNTTGGLAIGGDYQGVSTLTWELDTKAAGMWQGGIANVSVLNIHGDQFSPKYLGSLQTASGIEADATTRLWEAWFQQSLRNGKLDVRAGQQSIDQEFMVSQYASTFVETMNGWPALPSYDMLSGGPAYPLSGLGARIRGKFGDAVTLLAGVYAGNPAGTTVGDPQVANDHGTTFSLEGGNLVITELQFAVNPETSDASGRAEPSRGLPGTYKVGFWRESADFPDQGLDDMGVSLADPASSGNPRSRSGNYSVYFVADQMIWRDSPDSPRSLNAFARFMGAPGDRNLIGFSLDTGVTLTAPFKRRPNDVAGFAVSYANVGDHVSDLDANIGFFTGNPDYRVRHDETVLEFTYQYQVTPWWQVQADLQFTSDPGAGAPSPTDATATHRIPNTWVIGVRTTITF